MVNSSAGVTSGGKATVFLQLEDAAARYRRNRLLDLEGNAAATGAIPDDGMGIWLPHVTL
jgi:hypothetical protein